MASAASQKNSAGSVKGIREYIKPIAIGVGVTTLLGLVWVSTDYLSDQGCQKYICFAGYSNAPAIKSRGSTQNVSYLGSFPAAAQCETACLKLKDKCQSFSWHSEVAAKGKPREGQCFAIHHKSWSLSSKNGAVSGRPRGQVEAYLNKGKNQIVDLSKDLAVKAKSFSSYVAETTPKVLEQGYNSSLSAYRASAAFASAQGKVAYSSSIKLYESTSEAVAGTIDAAYSAINDASADKTAGKKGAKAAPKAARTAGKADGAKNFDFNLNGGWKLIAAISTVVVIAITTLGMCLVKRKPIAPAASDAKPPQKDVVYKEPTAKSWLFADHLTVVGGRDAPADGPAGAGSKKKLAAGASSSAAAAASSSSSSAAAAPLSEREQVLARFARHASKEDGRVDAAALQDLMFDLSQQTWTLETCHRLVARLKPNARGAVAADDFASWYLTPGAVAEAAGGGGDLMSKVVLAPQLLARQAQRRAQEAADEPGGLLSNVMGGLAQAADGARGGALEYLPPTGRAATAEQVRAGLDFIGVGSGAGAAVPAAALQDLAFALGETWTDDATARVAATLDPKKTGSIPAAAFTEWFLRPGAVDAATAGAGLQEQFTKIVVQARLLPRWVERKAKAPAAAP